MKHLDPNGFGKVKGYPDEPTVKQGEALSGAEQDNNGKAELIRADVRLSFKDNNSSAQEPNSLADSCYGCLERMFRTPSVLVILLCCLPKDGRCRFHIGGACFTVCWVLGAALIWCGIAIGPSTGATVMIVFGSIYFAPLPLVLIVGCCGFGNCLFY